MSFTLSPASKATKRVLSQRAERRASVDSTARAHTVGDQPATEVAAYYTAPAERWTCANRIG